MSSRIVRIAFSGGILACAFMYFIAHFQFSAIPNLEREIQNCDVTIAELKMKKQPIDEIVWTIDDLKTRLETIQNLCRGHARYARILDRICNAVNAVDGVWLTRFEAHPNWDANRDGIINQITLLGYVSANDKMTSMSRATDFIVTIEKELREHPKARLLGVDFDRPRLRSFSNQPLKIRLFEESTSFMTRAFEIEISFTPRTADSDPETPFIFKPAGRRDPFVYKP